MGVGGEGRVRRTSEYNASAVSSDGGCGCSAAPAGVACTTGVAAVTAGAMATTPCVTASRMTTTVPSTAAMAAAATVTALAHDDEQMKGEGREWG